MSLTPGSRLGPYEVIAPLGSGGMGEVFRARDSRLGRDVAIKVLPAAFALDPERLARFEREARLLASLSHQNIAGIHGLEELDGHRHLILELVEGETLAVRIARGPLPIDEALDAARQIAAALDAAHEAGIVHRDLKPGNVMLTLAGDVKVLDFGLARGGGSAEPSAAENAAARPRVGPALPGKGCKAASARCRRHQDRDRRDPGRRSLRERHDGDTRRFGHIQRPRWFPAVGLGHCGLVAARGGGGADRATFDAAPTAATADPGADHRAARSEYRRQRTG
ncbi:MAG: serine/threonine-protein kinase [Candidatus Eisenbacteria bacterium]|nr:serine/threonine-protein kinase [Candidatus Eisenbacteria bacterium]